MERLRLTTGVVIFFGHIFNFGLLILFWLLDGYTFEEMLNVFAVIAPLFAAYLSLIVNYSFAPLSDSDATPPHPLAALFSIAFPIIFVVAIAGAITMKAFMVGLTSMDALIKFVGLIETIVGTYTAIVVKNLFPAQKKTTAPRRTTSR